MREIQRFQPADTLIQTLDPSSPFQKLNMDLAQLNGKHYLVVLDRYSGWPEITELKNLETDAVTRALERLYDTFGVPEVPHSNGGPQFR